LGAVAQPTMVAVKTADKSNKNRLRIRTSSNDDEQKIILIAEQLQSKFNNPAEIQLSTNHRKHT
jgi:hypothetical protein